LAKICIYCGSELVSGQKCGCPGSVSRSTGNTSSASSESTGGAKSNGRSSSESRGNDREQSRRAREKAREQARREQQRAREQARFRRKADRSGSLRAFFLRLMTSRGFSRTDSFPSKLSMSFLQTLFKPVTAAEAFTQNQDLAVSIFYLVLFALSFSLAVMRLSVFSPLRFAEGLLAGASAYLVMNALLMLSFRFLLKIRIAYTALMASFSPSAIYLTVFLLMATSGRSTDIAFYMTVISGLVAAVLLHFVSLKALTGQGTERLMVDMILVYFIFFMIFGLVASLMTTVPAIAPVV
jgi:hypothetical protein